MTRTNIKTRILLTLIALLGLSLSCNLPALSLGGDSAGTLEDHLQTRGLVFIEDIEINEDQVKISYQILPEDTPELITAGWLNALLGAYEAEPDAALYQLATSLNGQPYLEITARGLDLEGFFDEDLSPEEFLAVLEIVDQRPPDSMAWALLDPLGLDLDQIAQVGNVLTVSYWPGTMEDEAEVMAEWWGIFKALSGLGDKVEAIEIENLYLDGSVITVRLAMDDLQAYVKAGMSDLEFFVALEVETELAEIEDVIEE